MHISCPLCAGRRPFCIHRTLFLLGIPPANYVAGTSNEFSFVQKACTEKSSGVTGGARNEVEGAFHESLYLSLW